MHNQITYKQRRRRGQRARRRRGTVGGPLFWTPAMIADYMRRTNSMVLALNGDYEAAKRAGTLPAPLESSWVAFRKDWKVFFNSNKASWSGGTVDRAEDYREQLVAWRANLAKHHKPQSPAPHLDRQPEFPWFKGAGTGALVVFVAIGAYLLFKSQERRA